MTIIISSDKVNQFQRSQLVTNWRCKECHGNVIENQLRHKESDVRMFYCANKLCMNHTFHIKPDVEMLPWTEMVMRTMIPSQYHQEIRKYTDNGYPEFIMMPAGSADDGELVWDGIVDLQTMKKS